MKLAFIIKHRFPGAELMVFDFYNSRQHTDTRLLRERAKSVWYIPIRNKYPPTLIPVDDKTVDIVFLLSAVHEIRSQEEKVQFLKECHRICKPGRKSDHG